MKITYAQAEDAAKKVRGYIDMNESCRGVEWCDITFDLAYILQEWRCPNMFDISTNRNDFTEEYEFINNAATHNWHMYEDPEYD